MKIHLSSAKECQTLRGWGTSACWWSQYCQGNPAREIARLLYSKEGLGLNIYRYNIGGGTDIDNCRVSNPWRRTDSMLRFDKEKEEYSWDFSRDKNAVDMMKRCLDYGTVDTLILFCNSPHYSQCSSGQASGSLLYHHCNIPLSKYEAFVNYVLDVAQHFIDEGLPVKYISPINEPQWKWGGTHVWQEGCHYEPEEVRQIFSLFARTITRRGMDVRLYGPESGEYLGNTMEYLQPLFDDRTVMSLLDVVAVHSYHCDTRPEVRYEFADRILPKCPVRVDMSEWCELPNKSHTKDFKGALITARIIGQDLAYAGCESWTSWVAVNQFSIKDDGNDYCDALISANDDFSDWYIAKRYYALAHYTKFIPVGSRVLDLGLRPTEENNSFNVFGFVTPDNSRVLVVVNEGAPTAIDIEGEYDTMTVIRSCQDDELAESTGLFVSKINIDQNSIYTIVIK